MTHHLASDSKRLMDGLHPEGVLNNSWDAKVGGLRTERYDEMVIFEKFRAIELDRVAHGIDGDR